jgi:hypothetical protein
MSADAKVWQDEAGHWRAVHDGDCAAPATHVGISYELVAVLQSVEQCMAHDRMRWEFRTYPDGQIGLSGYTW